MIMARYEHDIYASAAVALNLFFFVVIVVAAIASLTLYSNVTPRELPIV